MSSLTSFKFWDAPLTDSIDRFVRQIVGSQICQTFCVYLSILRSTTGILPFFFKYWLNCKEADVCQVIQRSLYEPDSLYDPASLYDSDSLYDPDSLYNSDSLYTSDSLYDPRQPLVSHSLVLFKTTWIMSFLNWTS